MSIRIASDSSRINVTGLPDSEQLSLPRALIMHLLPGAALALIFYVGAPIAMRHGYPAIAAGVLAAAVAVVGGELGWLLYQARARSGHWSIRHVLPYRPTRFTWRKALAAVGLFIWALVGSVLASGIKVTLANELFGWMPDWAIQPLPADAIETSSGTALVLTGLGFLFLLALIGPFIEELYFRGYLLPRLARFGAWAPALNMALFAVYHLWKPWDVFTLIIVLTPMAYVVWRTRDIRIGIAVHVSLNSLAFLTNVAPLTLLS